MAPPFALTITTGAMAAVVVALAKAVAYPAMETHQLRHLRRATMAALGQETHGTAAGAVVLAPLGRTLLRLRTKQGPVATGR